MGSIIKAICQCGFESEDIYAGGGMADFMTRLSAPAYCKKCHSLVVSNYLSKRSRCPKCRGRVIFYNNKELQISENQEEVFSWAISNEEDVFRLPKTLYLCPRCGKMKLEFHDIGLAEMSII